MHYRPYAIDITASVTKRETDSRQKSRYYTAILHCKNDCSLWEQRYRRVVCELFSYQHKKFTL